MPMSRHSTLLWLSLLLGSAAAPAATQSALPAPVEAVRNQLRNGQIDAAIEAGEAAVKSLDKDAQAWFWLGRAYAQQALRVGMLSKPKWAGKTREAYEQAVALDPEHVDARFDLMQYYVMAPGFLGGGRDKADAQATTLRHQDPVMGKLAEAMLAQHDDKPDLAERAYRDAVTLAPDSARARVSLSMHLQRATRWDESEQLWQQSLARNPDDALAHYHLGRLAAVSGTRLEPGLEHIQRYFAIGGEDDYMGKGGGHWRRGQILEKLGRLPDARAAYAEAVRENPALQAARDDLKRLED